MLKSVISNCLHYNYVMSIFSYVVAIWLIVIKATEMAIYVVMLLELYVIGWPSLDFLQGTVSFDISFTLKSKPLLHLEQGYVKYSVMLVYFVF